MKRENKIESTVNDLDKHLVPESLDVLQLLLLLHNPPLFSLFLSFGLCLSPGFLSYMLCTTSFCCLLQMKERLLLLLMPLLLLEHFSIVLRNVRGGGKRHNDMETRAKSFFFHLCIINLGVKIVDGGLYFYLLCLLYFILFSLFLEQLRLGSIGHAVTSVTSDGIVT